MRWCLLEILIETVLMVREGKGWGEEGGGGGEQGGTGE